MWNSPGRLSPAFSARRWRSRVSSTEQLELRIVPAADVTVIVRGGSLILTGSDPLANSGTVGAEILIRQSGPATFVVQNVAGALNGKQEIGEFSGVSRDLRINFGIGDDSLMFDQTTTITVRGTVSIYGGGGHNSVSSEFHNDDFGAPLIPGALKIGGSLSIVSAGSQSVDLYNLDIRRDIYLRNEEGDAHAAIGVRYPEGSQFVPKNVIGGNAQILNGSAIWPGHNETSLDAISVKGSVTIRNRSGSASINIGTTADRNVIGGRLEIVNGTGEWSQTNLANLEVRRDLQIDNYALTAATWIGSSDGPTTIARDLRVLNHSNVSEDSNASVAVTTINNARIGHILEVRGDTESQAISLLSSTITGNTLLKGGHGDDVVFLRNSIFKGDFLLQTGNGNDVLMVGASGSVLNMVFIQEARSRTVIDPISGEVREETYTVEVPRVQQEYRDAGPVKFCKRAQVRFGPGDDLLNLATDAVVTFQRNAVLNGQNGRNAAIQATGNVSGRPSLKHLPNVS